MINAKMITFHQSTMDDGTKTDWSAKLQDKEIFKVHKNFTDSQVAEVRSILILMLDEAVGECKEDVAKQYNARLEQIVTAGDAKLDMLKAENERLSAALTKIMINEE